MYIKVSDLRKRYNRINIINKISFTLGFGEKVGLIGKNGSGKTTLLKLLAGLEVPTSGEIFKDPPNLTVGYHEQVVFNSNSTIKNFILSSISEIKDIKNDLDKNFDINKLSEYEEKGGFKIESRIRKVLNILSLSNLSEESLIKELSGGERTRLQLAPILISKPNILLLDEPTNHLDLDGINFLQEYIANYKGIVIIATHDKALLEESITRIIEIDKGHIFNIKGNLKSFQLQKELLKERELEDYSRKELQLKRLVTNAKSFQQAQTDIQNGTKYKRQDSDKMGFNFLSQKAERKFARKSEILNRKIDEYEEKLIKPKLDWKLKIDLKDNKQQKLLFELKDISKSYNNINILENINLNIYTTDRICLIGRNGSGKSTLIKILKNLTKTDSGDIKINPTVNIGYLSQDHLEIDVNKSILDDFLEATNLNESQARTYLHKFLFKEDDVYREIYTFSQGEKAKYAFSKLLHKDPEFLLLDEPTNYLDLESKDIIEKALTEYKGGFIVATHDKNLIKILKPSAIIDITKL